MAKVIVYGGLGALLNCVVTLFSSSLPLDHVVNDLLVQPFAVMKTVLLLPAAFGFIIGTVVMLIWTFLKAYVIRALLQYNGWFLNPRSPVNKIWYLLMIMLVGKKNLGAGKYQDYLPSLPVPPLKKTMKRYLNSVKPLLSKEQYQQTEKAVEKFLKKDGFRLQLYLKLRSLIYRNWISDWWEEYIYFRQRTPISFNSNYYGMGRNVPASPHQLDRAATAIHLIVNFLMKASVGKVPNMIAQSFVPFCMEGTKYYANTARIPGREIDTYKHFDFRDVHHIVVLRQGKFYKVQVATEDGRLIPSVLIKKQLEKVVEMAGDELDETGVMTFTARPRTEWAEIRERLEKDPLNKETLHMIDSCYQVISLETESPPIDDYTGRANSLFHGNMYNRWFDKCANICVYANGLMGSTIEHSLLDATACAQVWEYMLQNEEYDEDGHVLEASVDGFPTDIQPQELKWNLEGFEDELEISKDNLREMIADSDLVIAIPSYGKSVPKECKLSPDGWFQMAIQLAYYRMYHRLVLTYESATTRLYYKGRTETIRPVSMESKAFVESMDDSNVSKSDKKKLLKAAIKYQEEYKFEAMRGLGIDRHLFGLYIVAKWLEMDPLPELFQDESFKLKFVLSTSQTPTQVVKENWKLERTALAGGFGTVTDDGYGVSYIIVGEEEVYFSIHSKRSCPTTSSEKFGEAIKTAFDDMKGLYADVLESN